MIGGHFGRDKTVEKICLLEKYDRRHPKLYTHMPAVSKNEPKISDITSNPSSCTSAIQSLESSKS